MEYKFYIDSKHTTWYRDFYTIQADSEKEAIAKIKEQCKLDPNIKSYPQIDDTDIIQYDESETLFDTSEFMLSKYNGDEPTVKVYLEDNLIMNNTDKYD